MKIDNVIIFDDFCISPYHQFLKRAFIDSERIPYILSHSCLYRDDGVDEVWDSIALHTHIDWRYVGPNAHLLEPFHEVMPFLVRCRTNITFPTEKNQLMGMHTDLPMSEQEYFSAIYYLNANDGSTVVSNPVTGEEVEVEAKENRLLVFPGRWNHSAYTPTNVKFRGIINFCFFSNFMPERMSELGQLQFNISESK